MSKTNGCSEPEICDDLDVIAGTWMIMYRRQRQKANLLVEFYNAVFDKVRDHQLTPLYGELKVFKDKLSEFNAPMPSNEEIKACIEKEGPDGLDRFWGKITLT